MIIRLLLIGFISILGQVAILRELNVAFYGVELIYLLSFGLWLLGTGIGALCQNRFQETPTVIGIFFTLFSLLLPLDLVFIRGIRLFFGGVPGSFLPFHWQLLGMAMAVTPLGVILGGLFRQSAGLYLRRGGSLAFAYGIESAGAVVGGIAAMALLIAGVPNLSAVLICAVAAALGAGFYRREKGFEDTTGVLFRRVRISAILIALGMSLLIGLSANLDRLLNGWNHPNLIATRDTPYGRVTVSSTGGQLAIFENGVLSCESEGTTAEEFVHAAVLQCGDSARILLLGGAVEGLAREALMHKPDRLDCIELDQDLYQTVFPHLSDGDKAALAAPKTNLFFGDPRQRLKRMGRYDLIVVGTADPATIQSNRFFTREFFELIREHLSANGIVAIRLRSAENYWSPQLAKRNASIADALKAVFTDQIILPGATNIGLASNARLERNPNVLAERYRRRAITARLVTPDYLRYLYRYDRISEIAGQLNAQSGPLNTDGRPVCIRHAAFIWLSKYFPSLLRQNRHSQPWIGISFGIPTIIFLGGVLWMVRRGRRIKPVLLTAIAGFSGMALEVLLLLHYQSKVGILFQDLGWLLAVFMVGLAVGAIATGSALRTFDKQQGLRLSIRGFGIGTVALLSFLSFAVAWASDTDSLSGWFTFCLLLFGAGFLTATIFAYAARLAASDGNLKSTGSLYAADLVGGAVATVCVSLIWIPAYGLGGTAIITGILSLVSLILFMN